MICACDATHSRDASGNGEWHAMTATNASKSAREIFRQEGLRTSILISSANDEFGSFMSLIAEMRASRGFG